MLRHDGTSTSSPEKERLLGTAERGKTGRIRCFPRLLDLGLHWIEDPTRDATYVRYQRGDGDCYRDKKGLTLHEPLLSSPRYGVA
jgi:hypothetical protein